MMSYTYFKFRGGIHPPDNKKLSEEKAISTTKVPNLLTVPLVQHVGAPCKAAVAIGQLVKKGELIGTTGGFISANVHSPVSGKVTTVCEVPHPSGKMVPAIAIENDGLETWAECSETPDYLSLKSEKISERILSGGIVGMGGATFPTHVKLLPPKNKNIDTLIINGVECEPYLTADYRLMLEKSREIIEGTKILMVALGVKKAFIGIEANKPKAIETIKTAASGDAAISVVTLKVKYPQGAEKMLIKSLVNRKVPPGALPLDVGVVVQNVATAVAVYDAVRFGRPLIERVVTVTGDAISQPKNILARIGSSVSDLVNECGGFSNDPAKVIMGGPMMGFALHNLNIPVTKGTSGIIALSSKTVARNDEFSPCFKCGRCIDVCPMGLTPSLMGTLSEKGFHKETQEYNIFDCFECGSCTFVCPSKRPLVQFIKLSKAANKSMPKEKSHN